MKTDQLAYGFIIFVASAAILIYFKSIIIPFVFAVIIWFLIKELKNNLRRVNFIRRFFPNWGQNLLAFIIIIGTITLIGLMLGNSVKRLIEARGAYEDNIQYMVEKTNKIIGIDIVNELKDYVKNHDLSVVATNMVNSLSNVLSDMVLILIYVLFLMAEEYMIPRKIHRIYNTVEGFHAAKTMINEIDHSLSKYIFLKTFMSFLTGAGSYIALLFMEIDFPLFWSTIIFLLNFIPTIGSIVATIFPACMALLQYTSYTPFFMVLLVVGSIQVLVGNVLEPRIMGNSLNISALVVLISLSFWGTIWGIVGMFLSVPITVMLIIIFSRFKKTQSIAVWLSGDGKIH